MPFLRVSVSFAKPFGVVFIIVYTFAIAYASS